MFIQPRKYVTIHFGLSLFWVTCDTDKARDQVTQDQRAVYRERKGDKVDGLSERSSRCIKGEEGQYRHWRKNKMKTKV